MNVYQIVSEVINGTFSLAQLSYAVASSSSRDDTAKIIDKNKPIKNILTDLVVNEYLKSNDKLCNFITFIYVTFNDAIQYYNHWMKLNNNQLFFVYKGGNVLRLVYDQSFYMLPGDAKESIWNYYRDSFKRSDADFSIYIDPAIDNYNQVFEQITTITYYLQNYIRLIFLQDPGKWFDYYNLSDNAKINLLQSYLTKINEAGFDYQQLTLPEINLPYYPKKDTHLYFVKQSKVIDASSTAKKSIVNSVNLQPIHLTEHDNPTLNHVAKMSNAVYGNKWASEMTISVNETTTFRSNHHLIAFNLVRTKIFFNLINGTHDITAIGGELIDVSIPFKTDDTILHFFQNVKENVVTYTKLQSDCQSSFQSYSVAYLIDDLEHILFTTSKYPWDDAKYAKRLKRLIFLYYLSLFTSAAFTTNEERISYLQIFKQHFIGPLRNIQSLVCTEKGCQLDYNTDEIESFSRYHARNYPQFIGFTHLAQKIIVLHADPQISLTDYNQFIELILQNLAVLQESLLGLQKYINSSGHIDGMRIYQPV